MYILFLTLLILGACTTTTAPKGVTFPPGGRVPYGLTLPPGYRISIYAHDLGEVRSIAFGPTGIPYVTVMNRGVTRGGKVLALPDANHDGEADRSVVVADGLDRPHGIDWHAGQLYVSEVGTIWQLRDTNGDLVADERKPVVQGLPTSGDHWARPFVFDNGNNLLVAIGSTCNICQEGNKRRASILSYMLTTTPTATAQFFARGLRSVVGLAWRPGTQELWATNNGRDELGPQLPPDQLFHVEQGKHYGWPYCYGDRVPDPEAVSNPSIVTPDRSPKPAFCQTEVTPPALLLPPHSAPLGLTFYDGTQFPQMRGSLFVALHGAFDFENTNGYRVVRIPFKDGKPGTPQDFITGWVPQGLDHWLGRPVEVAVGPEGSLYITDDVNGYLYRVDYVGGA